MKKLGKNKYIFLILSSWGMLISPLYIYISFIFYYLPQKPIPISFFIIIFLSSTLITYFHEGRELRIITIIGFHSLGFLFTYLLLHYSYYNITSSFWDIRWIYNFFTIKRSFIFWFGLAIFFSSILII